MWLGCAHRVAVKNTSKRKTEEEPYELESLHVSNYALRSLKHKDTRHTGKQFP